MMSRERRRPSGPPAGQIRSRPGGVGRSSSPQAVAVSDDLRRHTSGLLEHRRAITRWSLLASGLMAAVLAYQAGLVRKLPEPPIPGLDAERVDASAEAYQLFKMPDAALGMVSYAVTAALATAGSGSRWQRRPWLPLAMAAKVGMDALGGLYLTAEQVSKHRRICSWCTAATIASLMMVPHAVPEATAAARRLAGRSG